MVRREKFNSSLLALTMVFTLGLSLFTSTSASVAATSKKVTRVSTFVGGDIHTLTFTKDGLFVTGHEAGSYSTDEGIDWQSITSLKNADIMGWATTDSAYLAGGHNGLYRSTNNGKSFTRISFYRNTSDVHALGAANKNVYMGSPQVGFLRSVDGGRSWKVVNKKFGQGFMGSMLVDPTNPLRVIAPDMTNGLVETNDGGKTWARFGILSGAMSMGWNQENTKQIVALAMGAGALTNDGGNTWTAFQVPMGAAAVTLSSSGSRIFVATLVGKKAVIFSTDDAGKHWVQ